MSCIVCHQEAAKKYKCPKCLEPYCSLNCWQKHQQEQEKCSAVVLPTSSTVSTATELEEPTLHDPFTTEDTVPREKLEQLKDCEELRNLLHNPHLRDLLREIDVAPSAWKAMRAAMQEPLFVEFADECLKVVEPMSAEERAELSLS